MTSGLLIAQAQQHGPPHVWIVGALAVAVVGWLIYRAVAGRSRPEDDPQSDLSPAQTHGAPDTPEPHRGRGH